MVIFLGTLINTQNRRMLGLLAMVLQYFPLVVSERLMSSGDMRTTVIVADLMLCETVLSFVASASGIVDLQALPDATLTQITQYLVDATDRFVDLVTSEDETVDRPSWGGRLFRCIALLVSANVVAELQRTMGGFEGGRLITALAKIAALPFTHAINRRPIAQRHLSIFPQALSFLNRTITDCTDNDVDSKAGMVPYTDCTKYS